MNSNYTIEGDYVRDNKILSILGDILSAGLDALDVDQCYIFELVVNNKKTNVNKFFISYNDVFEHICNMLKNSFIEIFVRPSKLNMDNANYIIGTAAEVITFNISSLGNKTSINTEDISIYIYVHRVHSINDLVRVIGTSKCKNGDVRHRQTIIDSVDGIADRLHDLLDNADIIDCKITHIDLEN